jgi:peroxiredoxin
MTRLTVGDVAPTFELPVVDATADGAVVRLAPAEAAATVVIFTANGCPYARAWHDRLQDLAREYAGRRVTVLHVVSNDAEGHPEDSLEAMQQRVAAGEFATPLLHDTTQAVAQAYGATATPEVFVLDSDGLLRYHGAPDGDYDDDLRAEWVREALDEVLDGREVTRPTTSPAGCSIKWRVELLWWEGCPSHREAEDLLTATLDEVGKGDTRVVRREVRGRDEASELGFPGSPTFHVGGRDLFPAAAPAALTCRIYQRADGRSAPLPDGDALAERLRDVLARPWELPGWVDFRATRTTS